MNEEMELEIVDIKAVKEHPNNKGLFKDIKDTSESFWEQFKDSIQTYGILEPLIVNRQTGFIRSGNQRYKAAIELGFTELPVVYVPDDSFNIEEAKMKVSNIFRRHLDPFALMEEIGRMRIGATGSHVKVGDDGSREPSLNASETGKMVGKHKTFVSTADIYLSMSDEEKAYFQEKVGLDASTAKITEDLLKERERELNILVEEKGSIEEAEKALKGQLDDALGQLETSKDYAVVRDLRAEIARLKQEQKDADEKLSKAVEDKKKAIAKAKLERTGDDYLNACISHMKQINAVIDNLLEYRDELDPKKWQEFVNKTRYFISEIEKASGNRKIQITEVVS